jgi:hypothetical protein
MTCRCNMCGVKNAGKISRKSYAMFRLIGDERRKHSEDKDATRKLRRTREKNMIRKEVWS